MSNNNLNNLPKEKVDELLKLASQRIGSNPSNLKSQLENGNIENVIKNLNSGQANKLKNVLSNPAIAKSLLNSPQAQNLLNKLSKEK